MSHRVLITMFHYSFGWLVLWACVAGWVWEDAVRDGDGRGQCMGRDGEGRVPRGEVATAVGRARSGIRSPRGGRVAPKGRQ